jgi:ubiquinone/menaquinone biosynthesis C-methylase UbiE
MPDLSAAEVADYWDRHPHGSQFLKDEQVEIGSREFFDLVRPQMDCYRFTHIIARIEREAAGLYGKHLLEIGCGLGFDAIEFMRRGVRVTATDLTPTNVALAKRHFELAGVQPEAVEVGDAYHLSFAEGTFDAVYSCGVLGQMEDPARALGEIHRVLKPGGRAIMSHVYRRPSLFYVLSRAGSSNVVSIEGETPPVTHFFTEAGFRELFQDFAIEQTEREHHRLIPSVRRGIKAALYNYGLRPVYNLAPEALAKRYANKMSVVAVKPS